MSCACLAALTAIVLAISPAWKGTSPQPQADASQAPAGGDAVITEVSATASHPIYRYSVIAGGAHTRQELVDAIGRDQVVADHYRTILLDRVRVEQLTEARRAYVSYRVGDRVFWTKHQVTLPAGEPILTDGVKQIRARCGNCISYEPQLPTSDAEPDALEFEALAPLGNETLPSRAHGLVPPAVTPIGPTAPVNLAPSLPSGPGELASQRSLNGTGMTDGVPMTQSRKKAVVQTLDVPPGSDGQAGNNPGEVMPGGIIPGGLIPDDSIPGGSNPDGWIPDGPADGVLYGPLPGTLIPHETRSDDEFGGGYLSPDVVQPVPVPEPSSIVLLGTGVAGALWRRLRSRRKRGRAAPRSSANSD